MDQGLPDTVAVCHPYGMDDRFERTPKEIVGYCQYGRRVAEALIDLEPRLRAVIFAGGADDGQECYSLEEMIRDFSRKSVSCERFYDNQGLSTPAIIYNSQLRIMSQNWKNIRVIHFCDKAREYKVQVVCRYLEQRESAIAFQAEVVGFYRPDISPKSTVRFQYWETQYLLHFPGAMEKRLRMNRNVKGSP